MRICLDVCRVLKKILIALCVFLLIVVPLITMYTTYDGPSPSLKTFFQEVLYVLPLLPCLLMLIFPIIAAEQWLQTKIWDLSRTKLKRRLWILAICEIVLLAVILAMVIIGSEINHSLLMSIE